MSPVTVGNRRTVREKIQSDLETLMVGVGKPAQAIYAYQKGQLKGVVPCVVIVSGDILPATDLVYTYFKLDIHTFAIYEASGYTEQDSENDMDSMAADIVAYAKINADRTQEIDPEWEYLELEQTSIDAFTDVEGLEFRHEHFPFVVQVPNSG